MDHDDGWPGWSEHDPDAAQPPTDDAGGADSYDADDLGGTDPYPAGHDAVPEDDATVPAPEYGDAGDEAGTGYAGEYAEHPSDGVEDGGEPSGPDQAADPDAAAAQEGESAEHPDAASDAQPAGEHPDGEQHDDGQSQDGQSGAHPGDAAPTGEHGPADGEHGEHGATDAGADGEHGSADGEHGPADAGPDAEPAGVDGHDGDGEAPQPDHTDPEGDADAPAEEFGAGLDSAGDHHGSWHDDEFPAHLDFGADAPQPHDGYPWSDPETLGQPEASDLFDGAPADTGPADPRDLLDYAGLESTDGANPWDQLLASEDPATSALARWWGPPA